jgi:hypothetical protein
VQIAPSKRAAQTLRLMNSQDRASCGMSGPRVNQIATAFD